MHLVNRRICGPGAGGPQRARPPRVHLWFHRVHPPGSARVAARPRLAFACGRPRGSHLRQRLIKVGDQVVGIFNAHRKPQQARREAQPFLQIRGDAGMGR